MLTYMGHIFLPADSFVTNYSSPVFARLIASLSEIVLKYMPFVLTLITGILMMVLERRILLFQNNSYWTFFFYLTLMNAGPTFLHITPAHVANLFLVGLFAIMQDLHKKNNIPALFFNISLILSLAAFIAPVAILFLPVFWIRGLTNRTFSFKAIIASILGFVTPHIWFGGILFISTGKVPAFWETLETIFNINPYPDFPNGYLVFLVYICLLFSMGILQYFRNMMTKNSHYIIFFQNMLWALIPSVIFLATRLTSFSNAFALMTIPFAFLLSNLFQEMNSKMAAVMLLIYTLLTLSSFIVFV